MLHDAIAVRIFEAGAIGLPVGIEWRDGIASRALEARDSLPPLRLVG